MKIRQQANRGKPLETLVEMVNRIYRAGHRAVVHKVPTAWQPLRGDETGRVTGAKVEAKAAVDFLGVFRGRGIAFDAKHVQSPQQPQGAVHGPASRRASEARIRWDRIEPHQAEFLQAWVEAGGLGFVLVSFDLRRHFMIPWWFWAQGLASRSKTRGTASITAEGIPPEYEITATAWASAPDYLTVVERLLEGGVSDGPGGETAPHGHRDDPGSWRDRVAGGGGAVVAVAAAGGNGRPRARADAGSRRRRA